MSLSEWIRQQRRVVPGYSVRALADELGVHRTHLFALLNGSSRPSAELAAKIEQRTGGAVRADSFVQQ